MKKVIFFVRNFSFVLFLVIALLGTQSAFATPAGDNVLISEVEYDPTQGGTDQSYEWFELYNPTASTIDISGYQFTDGEPAASPTFVVIPNGTTLGSGEYFLAVFNTVNFQSEHAGITPDLEYGGLANASNFSLSNGGDEITLKNSSGTDIDFVSWEGHTAGWGIAADVSESIARNSSTDTDTTAGWVEHQVPTPGTGALTVPSEDFVITVKTNNIGTSISTQFTIPTTGGGYNYNVDCNNDGTDEATAQSGDYTCDYGVGNEGTYTIRIKDNAGDYTGFPRIYFHNGGDTQKILSIEQWGAGHWTSMEEAFRGAVNLVVNATDTPNLLSQLNISLHSMFRGNTSLGGGSGNWAWNTSDVLSFSYMFDGDTSFNKNISSWDVSRASQTNGMFRGATSFNQDISSWTPTSVTSMVNMFTNATSFNQDLSSWDVSNVTHMGGMFDTATSFDQDLSSWDMVGVTDVANMFHDATLSTANYDALLNSWNAQVLNNGNVFNGGNSTYCAAEAARDNMMDAGGHNWTITDGGKRANCNAPTNITLTNDTVDENSTTNQPVGNLAVVDPDGNGVDEFYQVDRGLNACVTPGADDSEFVFNGNNQLRMINSANYEVKSSYEICIRGVDDDGLFFDKNLTIYIDDVNEAPDITTDGGGAAALNIVENQIAVTTVGAVDEDTSDTVTYSITAGPDQGKFSIDSATGDLTFQTAPNFEDPMDANADNDYIVQVTATDDGTGALTDTQMITVTVTNVNENPVITSGGGLGTIALDVDENETVVTTVTATDEDASDTLTYSITGGADQGKFSIDSATGDLTFKSAPDFENHSDSGMNGVYDVEVTVTDDGTGALQDVQIIEVTVLDVNETALFTETPIFRLYNTKTGAQLYTRGEADRDKILAKYKDFEFTDGQPAFFASLTLQSGLTPIYRLYNTRTGAQLYTRGETDRNKILNKWSDFKFTDGGPAFYASLADDGNTPIYRLYNTRTGMQLYTRGKADRDKVLAKFKDFEFTDKGAAFYLRTN